eukprot:m.283533 g.283533  ORF g.283533 m.283533 type:complete len:169 (+) comp16338_c2_seq82:3457-3963(+)
MSLVAYGDDSDDSEVEGGLVGYYDGDGPPKKKQAIEKDSPENKSNSAKATEHVTKASPVEPSRVPSNWEQPKGDISKCVLEKMKKMKQMKDEGRNLQALVNKKSARNPNIYEQLVRLFSLDEVGSNCKPEVFNPKIWKKSDFIDGLIEAQKNWEKKRAAKQMPEAQSK